MLCIPAPRDEQNHTTYMSTHKRQMPTDRIAIDMHIPSTRQPKTHGVPGVKPHDKARALSPSYVLTVSGVCVLQRKVPPLGSTHPLVAAPPGALGTHLRPLEKHVITASSMTSPHTSLGPPTLCGQPGATAPKPVQLRTPTPSRAPSGPVLPRTLPSCPFFPPLV